MMRLTMDYDSIAKAGSMLGSGAVIVMDDTRCMVSALQAPVLLLLARILRPVHALPRRHRLAVARGPPHRDTARASWKTSTCSTSVADNIPGRTICALGDAAAMPVRGMLKHFRDEFEYHVEHKHCMVGQPQWRRPRRAERSRQHP